MKKEKWFDRVFDFSSGQDIFPSVVKRLSGTPERVEEKLLDISNAVAVIRIDDSWSIKENVGHLTDLEPLWQGRLEDILNNKTELRSTDLQNRKTFEANHNASPIGDLLKKFRAVRMQTLAMLQNLTEEQVLMAAQHPRLKIPMRTVDLFVFVAEHDDHHLARITELIELLAR